uniref:Uncharacterized protein n=1 Tax=Ciona savignyi TaxID=51511 RepID=H2YPK4_CIOSA
MHSRNTDSVALIYPSTNQYPGEKHRKTYKGLGITMIIFGSLSAVLGVGTLAIKGINNYYSFDIGEGIWCGALVVLSGSLSIVSSRNPTVCVIALSTVVAVIAGAMGLTLFGLDLTIVVSLLSQNYTYNSAGWIVELSLHGVLSLLGFIEMLLAITLVSYCSSAICCGNLDKPTTCNNEVSDQFLTHGASNFQHQHTVYLPSTVQTNIINTTTPYFNKVRTLFK